MPTSHSNDTVFSGINIFLQSKDGIKSENNSSCDFFLDRVIDSPRQDLGMLISVIDAEIPYSFYNISDEIGNNKLTINNIEVVIAEQNYSSFSIVDAFNQKFQSDNNLSAITIAFDDNTNRFKLSSGTPFTVNSTTMVKELGMDNLPQTGSTYVSNKVCNLAGTSSIYIRSDNMSVQNINSFGKTNGVLSKVLVDSSPGNFIFYQPSTPQYFILGNVLSYINIQLKNDDDKFIDFNGLDWSLTLSIEYYRKRDDTINYKYFLDSVNDDYRPKKPLEENPPEKKISPPNI